MLKVICIGDPHFKVSNIQETDEMGKKIIQICKEKNPDFIVVLGDVLHRHETIHVSPLMRAEQFIKDLSEICKTYVLVGNHDRPNNSNYLTDEHPFNALKHWNNTVIADKVVKDIVDNKEFLFVPYVPPGKFMDALNTIEHNLEQTTCIFAHQEFYGAKMGAIISEAGDKWDENNPLVISGHIHDYQQIGENVIYTGTAIQHSFGDSSDKAISLFTFENKSWNQERIDLGLIKKVIVYTTPEKVIDYVVPEDKLIKLVIRGDEASIKSMAKLSKIQELKKMGVKIAFKTIYSNNETSKQVKNKLNYKDRLYKEIQFDDRCVKWFHKLF